MMSNAERLVYMVNQIARNFATMGEEQAAVATADHLVSFWDPRMKAQILSCLEDGKTGLTSIAARAVAYLRDQNKPAGTTPATAFNMVDEVGHSDAG